MRAVFVAAHGRDRRRPARHGALPVAVLVLVAAAGTGFRGSCSCCLLLLLLLLSVQQGEGRYGGGSSYHHRPMTATICSRRGPGSYRSGSVRAAFGVHKGRLGTAPQPALALACTGARGANASAGARAHKLHARARAGQLEKLPSTAS